MSQVPTEFAHRPGPPLPVLSCSPFLRVPPPSHQTWTAISVSLLASPCNPLLQRSVDHEVVGMWVPRQSPFSPGPALRTTEAGSVSSSSLTSMPFSPPPTASVPPETLELPGAPQFLMALFVLHPVWGTRALSVCSCLPESEAKQSAPSLDGSPERQTWCPSPPCAEHMPLFPSDHRAMQAPLASPHPRWISIASANVVLVMVLFSQRAG